MASDNLKMGIRSYRGEKDSRLSAAQAGYMELAGAKKDGDCTKVQIDGGLSKALACCNEFQPESTDTDVFSCGTCKFVTDR